MLQKSHDNQFFFLAKKNPHCVDEKALQFNFINQFAKGQSLVNTLIKFLLDSKLCRFIQTEKIL